MPGDILGGALLGGVGGGAAACLYLLVMWGVTLAQFVLQGVGLGTVGKLFGFVGFVLALVLVSRRDRAATINGGWRLLLTVLGFFLHPLGGG